MASIGPFLKYCTPILCAFRSAFRYPYESDWHTLSGDFSFKNGRLRVNLPGEIEYAASEEMPDKMMISVCFYNPPDMKLEIRARKYQDTYVCFGLDFENNTIYLAEQQGIVRTVLKTQSHQLNRDTIHYNVELRLIDDTMMGFINGAYIIDAVSSLNTDEKGWSLYVPEIYENIITEFTIIQVCSLSEYPSEPTIPDDPGDFHQQYRKKLKEDAEFPVDLSYNSFWNARTSWERMKDFGKKDEEWSQLGYPVYPPLSENWFFKD